jgi:glutamyl-Q tRNA(Asp) synthetase
MLKLNSYRGRFAPTPSGELHFGSLITAVGSYLDARSCGGEWMIRIDDLDPPREKLGVADAILTTIEAYGFERDGEIVYQSKQHECYQAALEKLHRKDLLYYCNCSRKELDARCKRGQYGAIYDGMCIDKGLGDDILNSARIKVAGVINFEDRIQGTITQDLPKEVGDFILFRKGGIYAYHLAVVVDDYEQGITDVVRGYDLLGLTPQQIFLQNQLGIMTPNYSHLPLVLGSDGKKLSKSSLASSIDEDRPVPTIWQALKFLGQNPPQDIKNSTTNIIWKWATENWSFEDVPRIMGMETNCNV